MHAFALVVRRSVPLVAAAALTACGKAPPAAPPAPPPAEVSIVTLAAKTVTLARELPGRTSPSLIAEIRPQASGIVKRRLFEEGGRVKAGQVLYQLDDAIPRADVATARAAVSRAEATLTNARLTAKRSQELVRIDAVSRQDSENADAALRQAEADLASQKAALERAVATLAYSRITSPISGRIGKSSVTQGALVNANQATALATVQQLDPMYVDVTQSSAEWLELRKEIAAGKVASAHDIPVTLFLEDGSRYPAAGRLDFADVTVDPSTGSFLVRITVPNPGDLLLPGMYVRAEIAGGVRHDAILVPQQGVTRDPKGNASVMVVDADDKVAERPIKVSRAIGDSWLVDSGLAAGDRVIVEGLQKIRPGMKVHATEAAPPAAPPTPSTPAAAPPSKSAPAAAPSPKS
ncbi:MAG TPA: efflux RND transporter periplasmic adaptor subunit [Casimicrobiaceae bacterium]